MKYRVIVFDIDGTITTHLSSWRYIHEKMGIWQRRAFRYQEQFLAGKITYRRFCELDAAHWKGMPEKRIRRIFNTVRYSKNAVPTIRRLKKLGFKLVAVSTGLQYIPDKIGKEMEFDYALSNRLVSRRGILTGGVRINIEHGAKARILKRICERFGVRPHQIISVGDSDGDIPLAKRTGYSIAFNSSSEELSRVVDYNCKTKDFNEVYKRIVTVTYE